MTSTYKDIPLAITETHNSETEGAILTIFHTETASYTSI